MLIDSHAHLNFEAFKGDLKEVIDRCLKKGMKVINVGSQLATSKKAVALAHQFENFFAAVGVHPIHLGERHYDKNEAKDRNEFYRLSAAEIFEGISKLAKENKVVAIGETGLDYFRLPPPPRPASGGARLPFGQGEYALQREYFLKHLELAEENNLPVILHCRGSEENPNAAYEEILEIIKNRNLCGVIHCFGSNLAIARQFVDLGFYIGITGIVTFGKKSEELQEVARKIPLEKILIETDCPYLAPEPHRGERNEPIYVELVAQKIAELKNISKEEVIEATGENAIKLFKLI